MAPQVAFVNFQFPSAIVLLHQLIHFVVDEYKNHYTQEMIDFVTQLCVEDLEMFKYNFEGVTESDWFYMREL